MPPLRLFPAAPEQFKISQRGPFVALEWTAPVRNRDGSEDIQLEAAEVLRRVMEIPPPPPPQTPVVQSSLEAVEGSTLPEPTEEADPAKETAEGKQPQQEETASPVPPETEEPEVTPTKEQPTEPAEPSEQEGEEPTESETTSQTTPSMVAPAEQAPPPPPPPFAEEATVIATVESVQGGEVLTFRDPWDPEWEGMRVEYAVRYINRKGRTGLQTPVKSIEPLPPIAPPSGVTTEIEEGLVRLRWSPIETSEDDELSFLYNVYRKSDADVYPRDPLNAKPLESTLYEDRTTSYDQEYCYSVRSVAVRPEPEPEAVPEIAEEATDETEAEPLAESIEPDPDEAEPEVETAPELPEEGTEKTGAEQVAETTEPVPVEAEHEAQSETSEAVSEEVAEELTPDETVPAAPPPPRLEKALIESTDSEQVCLTPRDTYAPPTPENLFAVEVSDGILLSWDDVPATDLGGYLVYRSENENGPFELVTEQPVPLASYTDRTTEPGVVYYYTVSAVDRADPRNEGPRSRFASARSAERP